MPPATMTYEEAIQEAKKWAEGAQIGSMSAVKALAHICALPEARETYPNDGERVQLLNILFNILDNLYAWRGDTARAAKEAIKAQVRKLGGKI